MRKKTDLLFVWIMYLPKRALCWVVLSLVFGLALMVVSNVGINAQTTQTTCNTWASPSGLDTNAGTMAAPYKTPKRLVASLSSGQVGCLRGGSYGSGEVFRVDKSNITLMSAPGEHATLYNTTYVPNGANYVTLRRLKLDGTKNPVGTYGYMAPLNVTGDDAKVLSNEIINRNEAANQGGICVFLGESSVVIADRTLIQGNDIHACGINSEFHRHGIYVNWAHDTQVVGNYIYDVSGKGVLLYRDADHAMVRGNIIDRAGTGILFAGGQGYATDYATARNNIITNSHFNNQNITEWWETGVGVGNVAEDNCLWPSDSIRSGNGSGVRYSGNVYRDPLYSGYSTVADPTCAAILQAGW